MNVNIDKNLKPEVISYTIIKSPFKNILFKALFIVLIQKEPNYSLSLW